MAWRTESEELTLFRDNVRRYVEAEILPHYEQWEREGIVPRAVWNELGQAGFLAVDVPENYGGFGVDYRFSKVVAEEFNRAGCAGLGGNMAVHSDIVAHYLVNSGSEEQKQRYLPHMVRGEIIGAVAMTEPGAGSDLQGIRTTAQRDGDEYIINGSKTFITNGQLCDMVVVVAKTDPDAPGSRGTSLFIVDCDAAGFQRGRNLEKIGCHAADTSELFFDNVRVPSSALLGGLNQGFGVLMNELKRERLALAVSAVAAAEGVLAQTIEYVKERKAFGKAIAEFQNTRFKLAEVATDIEVHAAFVEQCVERFVAGDLDVSSVSMAKLAATEMQGRITDTCLQLFGGYGYMSEYPVGRAWTDARVQRIYGGTSEIMKELISRDLFK